MLSETLRTIISQIAPVAATGVVAFLVKEITPVGTAAISFIRKKEEAVATKIGVDKYNSNLAIAKNIWNMIDEEFRITPTLTKTIEAAQAMFAEKILKVIPGLTADEIEHLRQAVAGEVNQGKAALTAPVEAATQTVTPTVKYYAPDGTELQPVTTDNTTQTVATDAAAQPTA